MTQRRAIFFDRDGVICENRPDHVKSWDEFVFIPGALDAMRQIAASDFLLLVTTNQAAIARGMTTDAIVRDIHARMDEAITKHGGWLDAIYFCPHLPEANCNCRKPRTGMYEQGKREWDIDFAQSYVIGDSERDIGAANAIGAQPILVLTGVGMQHRARLTENHSTGYHVADDLPAAIEWILEREKGLR